MIAEKLLSRILTARFKISIYLIFGFYKICIFLKLPGKDYFKTLYEIIKFCDYPLRKPTFYISRYVEYPLAVSSLAINNHEKVLDLGAGDSHLPVFLKYRDRKITCIDGAYDVLKKMADLEKYETDDPKYIDKSTSDISKLGIKSECIDKILCISVIEHLPEDFDIRAIGEISRVLKKGGRAFISFEMSDNEEAEWHRHLKPVGKEYRNLFDKCLEIKNGDYVQFCRRYSFPAIKERLLCNNKLNLIDSGVFNSPLIIRNLFDENGNEFIKNMFDWIKPLLAISFMFFRKKLFENNCRLRAGSFGYIIFEKK